MAFNNSSYVTHTKTTPHLWENPYFENKITKFNKLLNTSPLFYFIGLNVYL